MKYLILLFFSLLLISCGTQSYLTQRNIIHANPKSGLDEVKNALKKPVVNPDELDKGKKINQKTMEELETSSFASTFERSVNNIIIEAKSYMGTPYRYGGTTRSGIDCSSFMQHIYKVENIRLPRVSARQAKTGVAVSRGELQKGDLIFFSTTSPYRITHVGMVTDVSDDIYFIHSSSSQGVAVSVLSHPYWDTRYRSARRPQKFVQPRMVTLTSND